VGTRSSGVGRGLDGTVLGNLLGIRINAVRYIAVRSLRTLPGFEGLDIDYASSPETRSAAVDRIFETGATRFIAAGETGGRTMAVSRPPHQRAARADPGDLRAPAP